MAIPPTGHLQAGAGLPVPRVVRPGRGWSLSGSNRPPPLCKRGALPDELRPQGRTGPPGDGAAQRSGRWWRARVPPPATWGYEPLVVSMTARSRGTPDRTGDLLLMRELHVQPCSAALAPHPPCRHSGSNGDPRGKSPLGLPLPHTGFAGLPLLGCVRRPGIEPGVSRVSGERRDRLARGGCGGGGARQSRRVDAPGAAPGASGVSDRCSAGELRVAAGGVGPTRVELITSGVSGRRSSC